LNINVRFSGFYLEPPIGIEPMTYALREARDLAALTPGRSGNVAAGSRD
jgi:hypothetical protein